MTIQYELRAIEKKIKNFEKKGDFVTIALILLIVNELHGYIVCNFL